MAIYKKNKMDTNYFSNILKFNDIILVILCYYLNCICVLRIRKCVITVIIKNTTNVLFINKQIRCTNF